MKTHLIKTLACTAVLVAGRLPGQAQETDAYTVPTTNGWTFYGGASFIVGYDFTPASNIQVTSLGILDWTGTGLPAASGVGIWDATGTLMASATLPVGAFNPQFAGAAGAMFYRSNIVPVMLVAGTTYRIGSQMFAYDQPLVGWGGPFTAAQGITFGEGWINNGSTFGEPVQSTNNTPYMGPMFEYAAFPTIISQPQSQTVFTETNVIFSVTVSGAPGLPYQWYFNGNPLADDGRVSGSTSNQLTIANVQTNDTGAYYVVVGTAPYITNSSNAQLTVVVPAQILDQPTNAVTILTSNVNFTVVAVGTGLSYQWFFTSHALSDGGRISGSTTASLNISNIQIADAGGYEVVVTGSDNVVTSSIASLTVTLPPPIIVEQPTNLAVITDSNAVFTVLATNCDSVNYQWQFNGTNLTDNAQISGSTDPVLTIYGAALANAGAYQAVASDAYGAVTSSIAELAVYTPAQITAEPTPNTALLAATSASFTVIASGSALHYQWWDNGTPLTDNGHITGSTTATLEITNIQVGDSGNYSVTVTNLLTGATSSNAVLAVYNPAQIVVQPVATAAFAGNPASFAVTATGTALGYQWFFAGIPLSDGGQITGSASPVLTITDVQGSNFGGYSVLVTNLLSATNSAAAVLAAASIRYVDASSVNPQAPYTDWSTAAAAIQDAIDVSTNGDVVVVAGGIYQTGGRVIYGQSTNRVAIDKAVTVQSADGPAATIIRGNQQSNTITGDDAVRCVYMTNGAMLIGFTLTGGATRRAGDGNEEESGGGLWCESTGPVISNCVITANTAYNLGGGVYQGTLLNCEVTGNSVCSNYYCYGGGAFQSCLIRCLVCSNYNRALDFGRGGGVCSGTQTNCIIAMNSCAGAPYTYGGGAYTATIANSLIFSNSCDGPSAFGGGTYGGIVVNSAIFANTCDRHYTPRIQDPGGCGGGAYDADLLNCTITGNFASYLGGGTYRGYQLNCINYFNICPNPDGYLFATNAGFPNASYCCMTPYLPGAGNISQDPLLAGSFHLSTNSPCHGAGTRAVFNGLSNAGTDIDGKPWAALPSMGCDEIYPGNVTGSISVAIAPDFTNAAPGFADGFRADISGPLVSSVWDFGDGATVTNEAYTAHTWATNGDFTITLTGYNDSFPAGQKATLTVHVSTPAIYYVDLNCPYPVPPYSDWSTAAHNIQDAIDAAAPRSEVLVTNLSTSNGATVYQLGGYSIYGASNRVAVYKPLTLKSVNGPLRTCIAGASESPQARCVYLTNGATLEGFTVSNGFANSLESQISNWSGGGVWCESTNCLITNCIVVNCLAVYGGGGVFSGTLENCVLTNNPPRDPPLYGGGAYLAVLNNCLLIGNSADYGGGASFCVLNSCILSSNTASEGGGGAFASDAADCTFWRNAAPFPYGFGGGGVLGGTLTNCTLIGNSSGANGGGASGGWTEVGTFSLVLNSCLISSNSAVNGGGLGLTQATFASNCIVNNCTVISNSIRSYGGGAFQAIMNHCTILNNAGAFSGGGSEGGVLNNCLLAGNQARYQGGGADGSQYGATTLNNCILSNNAAHMGAGAASCNLYSSLIIGNSGLPNIVGQGGGVAYGTLNNCLLIGNAETNRNCYGSAAYDATIYNSTIVGNIGISNSGAIFDGTADNCIVYYNIGGNYYQNGLPLAINYSCTFPLVTNIAFVLQGFGNISNAPAFLNLAAGDFHLQATSPCINSGDNFYVTTLTDLDGDPRIAGGTVDMGAYEYPAPSSILSYAWAQQYGLPTDGSADTLDLDGTGMPNWQKSIAGLNPTNPASVLAMWAPPIANNAGGVTVSWDSVSNRIYFLQSSTNLAAPPAFSTIQTGIAGRAGTTSYTDRTATNGGPYFYRVGIQ